jgi:hypothetical protein
VHQEMIKRFKDEFWEEYEKQKRAELEKSLEQGQIAEPISLIFTAATLKAVLIAAAVSSASYLISRAFAPKPPRAELGRLSGVLQLQNSEQGIFIPEIYGAGPTANIVTGANPTYQNLTNVTAGANGALTKTSGAPNTFNAGASHNVAVSSGQDAWIEVTFQIGAVAGFFNTASPTGSGGEATGCVFGVSTEFDGEVLGVINAGGQQVSHWQAGDVFRIELRNGKFHLYKNSAELTGFGIFPTPPYPLYLGVIMYASNSGVATAKVQIGGIGDPPNAGRGGIKVPAIIVWTSGIRKNVTTTQQQTGGGKGGGGGTQTVQNITYDIDLGMMFCRGPVKLIREYGNADILIDQFTQSANPSGVYDPGVGADLIYDPKLPPDPQINYFPPIDRVDLDIAYDADDVGSGTIQGGSSPFVVYSGTATQDPDPTIEAEVDARHGTGSTPAYRNHSLIVHKTFSLSRWSGIVPNITAVWEHRTLKTLDTIFASFCERVNVLAANNDYSFSGLSTIASRGMLIAGRPFAPAEVIGSLEIQLAYNYFVTEADGQLVGYAEGAEPSVTIADTEIGWLDADAEVPEIVPEVQVSLAAEISLPREVHVKSLDPDNEWESNTASAIRQITDGKSVELLEIQIAQLSDERRATAQKALYQKYVAGSVYKFTLSWKYLYLYPGYKIIITRAEGFIHTLRLTSISGGIGILECEGVALEPSVFTQPANGIFPPGYIPPQPIPAMTVVMLLDIPLLRDGDNSVNNGVGFYIAGVPRTGVNQNWQGFVLYIQRDSTWLVLENSTLPATIGTIVSTTGLSSDTSIFDQTGVFTVDLYGTTATLTSVTQQALLANMNTNQALFGNMVSQFATATQVAGFPNRWQLSVLLNGQRGTEEYITDTFTGKRFVLLDGAVKFAPLKLTDLRTTFNYRAATVGQSLGDAATVESVWMGATLKPYSPSNLTETRNAAGDRFWKWTRRTRIGGAMISGTNVPLGEELELYELDISTTGSVLKRTMQVMPGGAQAGILLPEFANNAAIISGNNLIGIAGANHAAYTQQQINSNGAWVEATLQLSGVAQSVFMYLQLSNELGIGAIPAALTKYYELRFSNINAGGVTTFEINVSGTLVFTSDNYSGLTMARVRVVAIGSEVRFYWDYLGPGSVPIYVSTLPAPLPLLPRILLVGASKATNVYVGSNINEPSVIYSAAQQTADGFTPNVSSVKVDLCQMSSLVGRGGKTTKTF